MTNTTTKSIGLDELVISPLNPRGNDADIEEIRLSLRSEKQLLYPLIVRPVNGKYEILDGSRRFRAAQAEKWNAVPCEVRELDDKEAMALILTVQLQHKDLDPFEEARTIDKLVNAGRTLPEIAKRVGKEIAYLTKIRALVNLNPEFEKWYRKGKLTLSSAVYLAKESPEIQQALTKELANYVNLSDMAVRNACQRTRNDLTKAPWDLKDASLPGGACSTCPFRTGNAGLLFSDEESKNLCTKPSCYNEKKEVTVKAVLKKYEQEGKKLPRVSDAWKTKGHVFGTEHYDLLEHVGREGKKLAKEALNVDTGEVVSVVFKKDFKPVKDAEAFERSVAQEQGRQATQRREEQIQKAAFKKQIGAILTSKRQLGEKEFVNLLLDIGMKQGKGDAIRLFASALNEKPAQKKQHGYMTRDYSAPIMARVKAGDVNPQALILGLMAQWSILNPGETVTKLSQAFKVANLGVYVKQVRTELKAAKREKKVSTK